MLNIPYFFPYVNPRAFFTAPMQVFAPMDRNYLISLAFLCIIEYL